MDWSAAVAHAIDSKISIPPDRDLPTPPRRRFDRTTVQVANATTLAAAYRLVERGVRPLALNLANGVTPGGGFLHGARAQEESLCRASALHATLDGDPMYAAHRRNGHKESSDWAILSPDVPVFRTDDGTTLPTPWRCTFLTCAAPYAPEVGQPGPGTCWPPASTGSVHRLRLRLRQLGSGRVGVWGIRQRPPPHRADFHAALTGPFDGAFATIVFAITLLVTRPQNPRPIPRLVPRVRGPSSPGSGRGRAGNPAAIDIGNPSPGDRGYPGMPPPPSACPARQGPQARKAASTSAQDEGRARGRGPQLPIRGSRSC